MKTLNKPSIALAITTMQPMKKNSREVMEVVISQALNATTAQINLLDQGGNPTETNVNCTLYDSYSGKILYNYIHTLNQRGLT